MLQLPIMTDAEMAAQDECFRDWLNIVDTRLDYEARRNTPLHIWRECFDQGFAVNEAIESREWQFVDLEMA